MKFRLLKIFLSAVYLALYFFLGVFTVQVYHGLYLEIIPWKYELATAFTTIYEHCLVLSLACIYIFGANKILVGLNSAILGIVCGLCFFIYKYWLPFDTQHIFYFKQTIETYPQNTVFVTNLVIPCILGLAFWLGERLTPYPSVLIWIVQHYVPKYFEATDTKKNLKW